ncbi:MAG TPA: hypothetical protein VKB80_12680 [Kofleriaceae bacterium]|nr:hypothetical protein [Kofleriaceae bacterium]
MTTDAEGRAAADVDEGGMVTVLAFVYEGLRFRRTLVGVSPGDELRLELPRSTSSRLGSVYVTVPPYPGASTYEISTACAIVPDADISTAFGFDVTTACLSSDRLFHLAVTAYDSDDTPIASAAVRDLAWTYPMRVTIPGWGDLATTAMDVVNGPASTVRVGHSLGYEVGGLDIRGPYVSALVGPGDGATLVLGYVPGFADRFSSLIFVEFETSTEGEYVSSFIVEWRDALQVSRVLDLTADFLPRISPPIFDTSDPVHPSMAWTVDGALAGVDGGELQFGWTDPGSYGQGWAVLVPPDVALPVRLPALPDELTMWAPTAAATFYQGGVQLVDAAWISSYDELRRGGGFGALFGNDVLPNSDASAKITQSGHF